MTAILNPNIPQAERLLDLDEVAKLLGGISTRSVRRLVAQGDLPRPVKVLSSPRLYYTDVLGYLERLKQKRDNQDRKEGKKYDLHCVSP